MTDRKAKAKATAKATAKAKVSRTKSFDGLFIKLRYNVSTLTAIQAR
jgi:hypothetical protein